LPPQKEIIIKTKINITNFFKIFYISKIKTKEKKTTFSQEGEDLIIEEIFDRKKNGFYIDIGAFHPFRFSNTALFYENGWRGINVDPAPGTKKLFDFYRPRDLNLECAVGKNISKVSLFIFDEPALNTCCDIRSRTLCAQTTFKKISKVEVNQVTLEAIFEKASGRQIDFLSIDVEGKELEILESADWIKNRPELIVLEILDTKILQLNNNPCIKFLIDRNYEPKTKSLRTVILKTIY